MAEPKDPRRPSPDDPGDDTYALAGGEAEESPAEIEAPTLHDPSLLSALDEASRGLGPGRGSAPRPAPTPTPPQAAPLPRLWKVGEPKPDVSPAPGPGKPAPRPAGPPLELRPGAPRGDERPIERSGTVRRPSETAARTAGAARRPSPRSGSEATDETGSARSLVEETPALDTYEARQTARIIIGAVGLAVCLIGGFFLYRAIFPAPRTDEADGQDPQLAAAAVAAARTQSAEQLEQEARALFDRARDIAKRGDARQAISLLERVTKSYPNTPTAREAAEALARPAQSLPLFLDRPAVLATAAPRPAPATDPPPAASAPGAAPLPPAEAPAPAAPASVATAEGAEPVAVVTAPAAPAGASAVDPARPEPPVGRPLPPGFRPRPGTKVDESGWPLEIVGQRDDALMVLVPGGVFIMGRDDGPLAEQPAHQVRLSTYYIDQHEVTLGQFNRFQKATVHYNDRDRAIAREPVPVPTSDDSPVVMITAKEARDYATWAGKRLPTEAQWEKAARGPDGRISPTGANPPEGGKNHDPRRIAPILSRADDVSPFGAFDMAGNAWEWTKDWYDPRYFQLSKNQVADDPAGPTHVPRTHQLAVKGGSPTWALTRREGLKFDQRLSYLGFRCVLPVEGPGNAFEPEKPRTTPSPDAADPGDGPAVPVPF